MSHIVPLECLGSVCISRFYILKYYKVSRRSSCCLYAYVIYISPVVYLTSNVLRYQAIYFSNIAY